MHKLVYAVCKDLPGLADWILFKNTEIKALTVMSPEYMQDNWTSHIQFVLISEDHVTGTVLQQIDVFREFNQESGRCSNILHTCRPYRKATLTILVLQRKALNATRACGTTMWKVVQVEAQLGLCKRDMPTYANGIPIKRLRCCGLTVPVTFMYEHLPTRFICTWFIHLSIIILIYIKYSTPNSKNCSVRFDIQYNVSIVE
jgi:hypothetical protein